MKHEYLFSPPINRVGIFGAPAEQALINLLPPEKDPRRWKGKDRRQGPCRFLWGKAVSIFLCFDLLLQASKVLRTIISVNYWLQPAKILLSSSSVLHTYILLSPPTKKLSPEGKLTHAELVGYMAAASQSVVMLESFAFRNGSRLEARASTGRLQVRNRISKLYGSGKVGRRIAVRGGGYFCLSVMHHA
jgi:hypothetical protein